MRGFSVNLTFHRWEREGETRRCIYKYPFVVVVQGGKKEKGNIKMCLDFVVKHKHCSLVIYSNTSFSKKKEKKK